MDLRYYQTDAIEAAEEAFAKGDQRVILVAGTGLGKTRSFNEIIRLHLVRDERVLLLAHREELIRQSAIRLFLDSGYVAAVEMAKHKEGSARGAADVKAKAAQSPLLGDAKPASALGAWLDDEGHEVDGMVDISTDDRGHPRAVVASVQSMCRRLDSYPPDHFDLIVVDECFPAGTLVGGVPIDRLRTGDIVPSYDEASGAFVCRRVSATMRRRPTALVRLWFDDGSDVVCTPEHPFLTSVGWVAARSCLSLDVICEERHERLRDMRGASPEGSEHVLQGLSVLTRVREAEGEASGQDSKADLSHMLRVRSACDHSGGREGSSLLVEEEAPSLLLGFLPGFLHERGLVSNDGRDESRSCLRAHDKQKPHEGPRHQAEDVSVLARDRSCTSSQGWERSASVCTSATSCCCTGVANGGHCPNRRSGSRIPHALQDRHRQRCDDDRCGGRRGIPQRSCTQTSGRKEGQVASVSRVVRVEVLERGGDGRYGGLCPDGFVYNIEVEGTHTYLVGAGLVVHNCHHQIAASYQAISDHFSSAKLLGVTATPQRGDKVALSKAFDVCAFQMSLVDGIEQGWLVPIRVRSVETSIDLSQVRTVAGDLNQKQLAAALSELGALHEVAAPIVEECGDRQGLVFAVTVAHAHLLAEVLREHVADRAKRLGLPPPGPRAVLSLDGTASDDERLGARQAFKSGECQLLVNCALYTEGVDLPSCSVVAMARPTKSIAVYMQALGRGTRPVPGLPDLTPGRDQAAERRAAIAASEKPDMIVLDFVGNAGKHKIVRAIDALAGDGKPEKTIAKGILARGEIDDVLAALAEARRQISEMEAKRLREMARNSYRATDLPTNGDDCFPFDVTPFKILGFKRLPDGRGGPMTDNQRKRLVSLGLDPTGLTKSGAYNLLKAMNWRRSKGLGSWKQVKLLVRHGIPVELARATTKEKASELIQELADNKWSAPRSWRLRFAALRDAGEERAP